MLRDITQLARSFRLLWATESTFKVQHRIEQAIQESSGGKFMAEIKIRA